MALAEEDAKQRHRVYEQLAQGGTK